MKVAILGATGFTGEKLVEILLSHPKVEVVYLASRTPKAVAYSKLLPDFPKKTKLKCEPLIVEKAAKLSDVLFLSLPHTVSMKYAPYLLKQNKRVIDLSADYRIKNLATYKQYYKVNHKDKVNLKKAVYGLPELYKNELKKADLVANAGCYPTSVVLALYPLLEQGLIKGKVVIDSKSSITGAGRKVADSLGDNVVDNIWAYKPFIHQHAPEIACVLKDKTKKSLKFTFIPHVISAKAGIYSTIQLSLKKKLSEGKLKDIYNKYYRSSPFIRIKKSLPKLKDVVGTNFCDIGFALDVSGKEAVVVSAIDNLIKGAAGGAVQNMNIMLGWNETLGLL